MFIGYIIELETIKQNQNTVKRQSCDFILKVHCLGKVVVELYSVKWS